VGELQRAISTVVHAVFIEKPADRNARRLIILGRDHPVRLRGLRRFALSMLHFYELALVEGTPRPSWDVHVVGYSYTLHDSEGSEILGFHWHPDSRSPIIEPHLHLKSALAGVDMSKAHVPTGIVRLPAFLRFLIRDFGVEPIRADWQQILGDAPSAR
jgi:hypothetical protein